MGLLHDHIMSRADGSEPGDDVDALGFNSAELFQELLDNENMTVNMVMAYGQVAPQDLLAKYAMTWLAIGMSIYKEKRDAAGPDDFPTLPDEPTR